MIPSPSQVDPASIQVQVSKAPGLRSQQWGNVELSLKALLDWIGRLRIGDKAGGEVWAPAVLKGRRRVASDALHVDLLVFDSDAGHTLAELTGRFESLGWYARIIPSASWGSTETEASADHYDAWAAQQVDVHPSMLPARYLAEWLSKVPAVADGAVELNRFSVDVPAKAGSKRTVRNVVRFRHGACEKYRIVCALDHRFDLSTREGRLKWKERYHAAVDAVGLPLDRTAGSPERLFFLPHLPADRLKAAGLHQAEIPGTAVDLSALPAALPRARTRKGPRTFAEDHVAGRGADDEVLEFIWADPETGRELDLRAWAARGGLEHLQLSDVLASRGWPQDERGRVGAKHHVECPFEAQHGSRAGGGTYIWNAADFHAVELVDLKPGAGIHCQHNSCRGRDRLEFLLELLRRGCLTSADLDHASEQARAARLEHDFEPIDPRTVLPDRPLVVPGMDWTLRQVIDNASRLRRLRRDAPRRLAEARDGWDLLGTIPSADLDDLLDMADDETEDDPDPAAPAPAPSAAAPAPAGIDKRWRTSLHAGRDGAPTASGSNIQMALEHGLGLGFGAVAYNELKGRLDIRDPSLLPWGKPGEAARPWTDNDDTKASLYVERLLGGAAVRPHVVTPIIESIGRDHAYHPVREYLAGLTWDGVPRLDRLLIDHGGAEDNPFVRAATARTLIAAVARVMRPGCKVDTALILESVQGFGKSTLFAALAIDPEFFTDNAGHLGERSSAEVVGVHWVVELAELSGLKKADLDAVKAFLSRRHDKYRPPYGRRLAEFPRQCIMVGTVNGELNGYLKDLTGNRRFWIVKVARLDLVWIDEHRDQIWAEAKHRYAQGERWWIDDAEEPGLVEAQAEAAKARTAEPELAEAVRRFLAHKPGVSGHDRDFSTVWTPREVPVEVLPSMASYFDAIGRPTRDIRMGDKIAFNQALQSLGWEVRQVGEKLNPIGLERGARFYISPRGVAAANEGKLHEWLQAQVDAGAVAGKDIQVEDPGNVIDLGSRQLPRKKLR